MQLEIRKRSATGYSCLTYLFSLYCQRRVNKINEIITTYIGSDIENSDNITTVIGKW